MLESEPATELAAPVPKIEGACCEKCRSSLVCSVYASMNEKLRDTLGNGWLHQIPIWRTNVDFVGPELAPRLMAVLTNTIASNCIVYTEKETKT